MRDQKQPLNTGQDTPQAIGSAALPSASIVEEARAVINAASTAAPEANGEVVSHISAALETGGVKAVVGVFDEQGLKVDVPKEMDLIGLSPRILDVRFPNPSTKDGEPVKEMPTIPDYIILPKNTPD